MSVKSGCVLDGDSSAELSTFSLSHARLDRYRNLKRIFLYLAFFALSFNLRAPITSLPPVIGDLQNALQITPGVAGLLTSIPVFCFGFLTPLLGWLMKRISLELSVGLTLGGVVLGSLVRSGGSMETAFLGTVLIGVALTVGNIAGLMVLGREFKEHASTMTGVYVCGMSMGATLTTAMTAPVAGWLGWQQALAAIPGGMALGALLLWGLVHHYQNMENQTLDKGGAYSADDITKVQPTEDTPQGMANRSLLKHPLVWLLSAAFAAHTFLFYGLTAWLPLYLKESIHCTVSQAGMVASLFQILGILGCMGIPALGASKRFSQTTLFLVVTIAWLATALGFFLFPTAWLLWIICGGIGSGGGFTVIFSLVMHSARDLDENRILSTVIQASGYAVASISPYVIGHLYTVTAGWKMSFITLAIVALIMTICGMLASSQKYSLQRP